MRTESLDKLYAHPPGLAATPANGHVPGPKYTPDCLDCWQLAYRITDEHDLAWASVNRVTDVVIWLHSQGCRRGPLDSTFHAELNEGLALRVSDRAESPEIRTYVPRVIQTIEMVTLLHLNQRLSALIKWGVVDADILLSEDHGHGPTTQLLRRLERARDTQGNLGGGLRHFMTAAADTDITPHEAHTVSLLLLGTAKRDQEAKSIRYGGISTQLGASSALLCAVLGVPEVSVETALYWAHTATRAMDPRTTRGEMRHKVTNPIKRMAASRSPQPVIVTTLTNTEPAGRGIE